MKTKKTILKYVLVLGMGLVVSMSCSKDDSTDVPSQDNVDEGIAELVQKQNTLSDDDFEVYEGAIGIIYNARNIAKKGYLPATATITVEGSQNNFTQTVSLDPTTIMGSIELSLTDLQDGAKNELEEGVPLNIEVKDANGNTIFSDRISKASFFSNPKPIELNVSSLDEPQEDLAILFNPNRKYIIQMVDVDGNILPNAMRKHEATNDNRFVDREISNGLSSQFDFLIQLVHNSNLDEYHIREANSGHFLSSFGPQLDGFVIIDPVVATFYADRAHEDDTIFKFIKIKEGVYQIVTKNGLPLRRRGNGVFTFNSSFNSPMAYFRFISTEINWSAASISTAFVAPILPKPSTSFGANSTLSNCTSGGGLSQTIGQNTKESITNVVGWSESLAITTSNTFGVNAEVKVNFGASFFGTGANYEASVSASYEYSRSVTENSTRFANTEVTNEESLFFERTVTVPPNSASLVYDVVQFYPNTEVQIAQKLRIQATYTDNGSQVSGAMMVKLLKFSRFDGVITEVGADYIEVSLLGTMVLDKVLETQSKVQEVTPDCN